MVDVRECGKNVYMIDDDLYSVPGTGSVFLGPNAEIYTFDQITAKVTHGGSEIYSGHWDLKEGLFTIDDQATNSRPIKYRI
jgi:hypothetical protein